MRRAAAAALALLVMAGVASCNRPDGFADACTERGGVIMEDETTAFGVSSKGDGTWTSVEVRLCVVDGDVVDMEVN